MEEEDSDDSLPAKHIKLNDSTNNSSEEGSSDDVQNRRKSPVVIDETKIEFIENGGDGDGETKKPLDIQALINIHGDLFKKCPFSSQIKAMAGLPEAISSGGAPALDTSGPSTACDLQGIGQDVMGECPVLNTMEKVELLNSADVIADCVKEKNVAKCPVTGHGGSKGDANGNVTFMKCPYSSSRSSSSTNVFPTLLEANGVDSCPFISSIKMVDCDENKNFIDIPNANPESSEKTGDESDSIKLYCGLVCHATIDHKVLESCELLGRQLAEKLIGRGALDVMKVAQAIIHSKIGN